MPFIGFSIGMGPFLFLILVLNWQERRDRKLQTKIHLHLNSQNLRGLIAVRTCSSLFLFRKMVLLDLQSPVYFDLGNCTNEEVWKAWSILTATQRRAKNE